MADLLGTIWREEKQVGYVTDIEGRFPFLFSVSDRLSVLYPRFAERNAACVNSIHIISLV